MKFELRRQIFEN